MKVWELFVNWLQNMHINWENAVVTLLAAFFGAWFAYRFNLKRQKQRDKERKEEEAEERQANQIIQLNYLKAYLITSLNQFLSVYRILREKQKQYDDIISRKYNIAEDDKLFPRQVIVDISYQMLSNQESLGFTMSFPVFLSQLAVVETNIKRFYSQIDFFNSRVEDAVYNYQLTKNIKKLVDSQNENLEPVFHLLYASVDSIDIMLGLLKEFVNKQGLILNFNQEHPSKEIVALVGLSKMKMKDFYEQKKS